MKNFKIATVAAILDIRMKLFSNTKSPCNADASHQVSTPSDAIWEEKSFEEFQDDRQELEYRNETILAILNLHIAQMVPINFHLNQT